MEVTTTGVDIPPLHFVLDNLRDEDKAEIEAVRGADFDRLRMAMELAKLAATHEGWLFWAKGEPIAALGAYAMTPKVAGCWAFGTAGWPDVVRTVTKHIRKTMIPGLLKAGFHRAECRALASRQDTERWLTALGWKAESRMSGFGVRREDFTLFAWIAPDERNDPPERSERESEVSLR